MVSVNIDELKSKISQMKKELIQIAEKNGLNSDDTLIFSQKLDKLILTYQRISYNSQKDLF